MLSRLHLGHGFGERRPLVKQGWMFLWRHASEGRELDASNASVFLARSSCDSWTSHEVSSTDFAWRLLGVARVITERCGSFRVHEPMCQRGARVRPNRKSRIVSREFANPSNISTLIDFRRKLQTQTVNRTCKHHTRTTAAGRRIFRDESRIYDTILDS